VYSKRNTSFPFLDWSNIASFLWIFAFSGEISTGMFPSSNIIQWYCGFMILTSNYRGFASLFPSSNAGMCHQVGVGAKVAAPLQACAWFILKSGGGYPLLNIQKAIENGNL